MISKTYDAAQYVKDVGSYISLTFNEQASSSVNLSWPQNYLEMNGVWFVHNIYRTYFNEDIVGNTVKYYSFAVEDNINFDDVLLLPAIADLMPALDANIIADEVNLILDFDYANAGLIDSVAAEFPGKLVNLVKSTVNKGQDDIFDKFTTGLSYTKYYQPLDVTEAIVFFYDPTLFDRNLFLNCYLTTASGQETYIVFPKSAQMTKQWNLFNAYFNVTTVNAGIGLYRVDPIDPVTKNVLDLSAYFTDFFDTGSAPQKFTDYDNFFSVINS